MGHDQLHETPHPFFSTWTESGKDLDICDARAKCVDWNFKLAGIHTQPPQLPARPKYKQTTYKGFLNTERLNGNVDPSSVGDLHNFRHCVLLACIDRLIGSHLFGHPQANWIGIDADYKRCTFQSCSCRGAQTYGPLSKHGDAVAELNVG